VAITQLVLGTPPGVGVDNASAPARPELRIDPNVASRSELMLLPRIGPALADYIIEYRESRAPEIAFRRAEELDNVYRIGPATVEKLRPHLRFNSPARRLARKDAN
jgi:competence protein ComEA